MFKDLVKRSKFKKIYISSSSPINMLIEGDEVYATMLERGDSDGLTAALFVLMEQKQHRELAKLVTPGDTILDLYGHVNLMVLERTALCDNANLLTGFSDYVTFSTLVGPSGADSVAEVVIETVNYEPRR